VDFYIGQLVVLRSRWNIHSSRVGIIIGEDAPPSDIVLVMWTDESAEGVKLKYHLKDAVLPVTGGTIGKIKERKFELSDR
jgi:hypothetical protein